MNILLVSASHLEIAPFREFHGIANDQVEFSLFGHSINTLITGIGMVSTSYAVTKALSKNYDLVIHAGIAGSYKSDIKIGQVVFVMEDCITELGAEDDEEFIKFDKLGFDGAYKTRSNYKLPAQLKYKLVRGATVNKVHGNEKSIERFKTQFDAEVETMEGAALQFVCEKEKIACVQIRSISNYVEKRNKKNWNIPISLTSLSQALTEFLKAIE